MGLGRSLGCGTAQKAAAMEPSQILGTRWNLLCPKTAPSRGALEEYLLSSREWKDVNGWALEIGISCTYSNPVVTGGQNTHTCAASVSLTRISPLVVYDTSTFGYYL
jgi:hypothetical protein